jgi:hypothetical protein
MKKTIVIMCAAIAALSCTCLHLYGQLQNAHQLVENTNKLKDEDYNEYIVSSGEWVSMSDYEDLLQELSVANDLIFYVEEVLDDPYIEDYLESDERKAWANYH